MDFSKFKASKIIRSTSLNKFVEVGDIEINSKDHVYLINGNALVHNCSFCKESHMAREFCQTNIFEKTGIIKINMDGQEIEIPSQIKVKFFDTDRQVMIFGPIQIPICKGYPISKDTLKKIASGEYFRALSD